MRKNKLITTIKQAFTYQLLTQSKYYTKNKYCRFHQFLELLIEKVTFQSLVSTFRNTCTSALAKYLTLCRQ